MKLALALALMCQLSLLLPTGGDTTRTEEMLVEVPEAFRLFLNEMDASEPA